jgi:hypothetical protein
LSFEDEDAPDPLLDEEDLFFYDGDDELWEEGEFEEV